MDVILKQDVEKLGFKNEIISVKNGFGRNYLIPKGLAILATESAVKVLKETLKQREEKDATEISEANKIAETLSNLDIQIKAKVKEDGKTLFGSIKLSQLTDSLSSQGHEVNPKFVKLPSIKELGDYEAEIRLHRNVKTIISFKIISD
jgi:large subunit ribosomal protein L9